MMTVEEASKKWGISKRTIYSYCKKGLINCEKNKKGEWIIYSSLPPYIMTKKKNRNDMDHYTDILLAIAYKKEIDYKTLQIEEDYFNVLVNELVKMNLIVKYDDSQEDFSVKNYIIVPNKDLSNQLNRKDIKSYLIELGLILIGNIV